MKDCKKSSVLWSLWGNEMPKTWYAARRAARAIEQSSSWASFSFSMYRENSHMFTLNGYFTSSTGVDTFTWWRRIKSIQIKSILAFHLLANLLETLKTSLPQALHSWVYQIQLYRPEHQFTPASNIFFCLLFLSDLWTCRYGYVHFIIIRYLNQCRSFLSLSHEGLALLELAFFSARYFVAIAKHYTPVWLDQKQ